MLRELDDLLVTRCGQLGLQNPDITDKLLSKLWNGGFDTLTVDDFASGVQLRIGKRHVAFFGFF